MKDYDTCFGCGAPIRIGCLVTTDKGKDVVICGRCWHLWEKRKAKEAEIAKGADNESS